MLLHDELLQYQQPLGSCPGCGTVFFFKDYLFMRDTHREAETQAEGEVGSMQGARRGTRSQDSGSRPGLKVALNC